jgi:pyruvate-formate lyase-activating enzyme
MDKRLLEQMLELSLHFWWMLKFDLEAFDEALHIGFCSVSNKRTLENFKFASR